jgi:hypothetical protein
MVQAGRWFVWKEVRGGGGEATAARRQKKHWTKKLASTARHLPSFAFVSPQHLPQDAIGEVCQGHGEGGGGGGGRLSAGRGGERVAWRSHATQKNFLRFLTLLCKKMGERRATRREVTTRSSLPGACPLFFLSRPSRRPTHPCAPLGTAPPLPAVDDPPRARGGGGAARMRPGGRAKGGSRGRAPRRRGRALLAPGPRAPLLSSSPLSLPHPSRQPNPRRGPPWHRGTPPLPAGGRAAGCCRARAEGAWAGPRPDTKTRRAPAPNLSFCPDRARPCFPHSHPPSPTHSLCFLYPTPTPTPNKIP